MAPRRLSASTRRLLAVLSVLCGLLLSSSPVIGVLAMRESREAERRANIWREGLLVEGRVVAREMPEGWVPGPRKIHFRYAVAGKTYRDERVMDADEWSMHPEGRPLTVRVDPADPASTGLLVDGERGRMDRMLEPVVLLLLLFVAGACLFGLRWVWWRVRLLHRGVEVPFQVVGRHGWFRTMCRVRYVVDGATLTEWVEIPPSAWPAVEEVPGGTRLLVWTGSPRMCTAAAPDAFDVDVTPEDVAAVAVRLLIALPSHDAMSGIIERLRTPGDDLLAALRECDVLLRKDPVVGLAFERWMARPANWLRLSVAERRALATLSAWRHVQRHVGLRLAMLVATTGAIIGWTIIRVGVDGRADGTMFALFWISVFLPTALLLRR